MTDLARDVEFERFKMALSEGGAADVAASACYVDGRLSFTSNNDAELAAAWRAKALVDMAAGSSRNACLACYLDMPLFDDIDDRGARCLAVGQLVEDCGVER